MKNGWTQYPTEKKRFWDIYLIKNDGEWLGFRLPLKSIQRISTYFIVALCLLSLTFMGWVLARWQIHHTEEELQQLRLERESFLKTKALGGTGLAMKESFDVSEYSVLPSLEAKDFHSILVEAQNFKVIYQKSPHQLKVDFELHRLPPRDGSLNIYWLLLLHGSPGVLSFPAAVTSRAGEVLLFHRGIQAKDIKGQLNVQKLFPLSFFVENASGEPLYASLYIYDDKGSLLARYRQSLEIER